MSSPAVGLDLAIIGAGPTGLFAAFYAGLRGMSVALIDSLAMPGGQLATLYPEKMIYDVAGFPAVRAKDLAARLVEQADYYRPTYHLGHPVLGLDVDGRGHVVRTGGGAYPARAVLIAAGVGAFTPRKLALPDVERFDDRGVEYGLRDVDHCRGKRDLIVGGGDLAVEWANALAPVTASQTLVHRRDVFRADEEAVSRLRAGPTRLLTSHEVRRLEGDDVVRRAIVYNLSSKQEEVIDVEVVLVNLGFESSLGAIADWGLALQGGQVVVDHTMMTTRPGVFAAGDVCTYPGKLKLLATAFGEAASAVNHAAKFLDPAANVFPGHSTNLRR